MPSRKESMNCITQGMIVLLLSSVHVSIIMGGDGPGGLTVFSWNEKCSPLSQKILTPLLCSKGGEDLRSLCWCKVLTALPEHRTAK